MAATPQQVAEALVLVQAYAAATQQARDEAAAVAQTAWLAFSGWYSADAVRGLAADMADLSEAGQDAVTGMVQQFVGSTTMLATGRVAQLPRTIRRPEIRNGVPLTVVHTRPAETYRKAVALGMDPADAKRKAAIRATGMLKSDMTLAERAVAQATLDRLGVTQYRRIIHPELSETGTCGLCVAASDRVYSTGYLMPIHPPECKCTVMPVVGEWDPGVKLNSDDLKRLYALAGGSEDTPSTKAGDLSRVRYEVNEHGEFGPVLTKAGDNFRGPDSVALEDDPERARRMLDQALPVLERMEDEGRPAGVLDYQRGLVARLTAIAA